MDSLLPLEPLVSIGIDATNISAGGGVTHLVEMLRAANPVNFGVGRVVLWGLPSILNAVDDRTWLIKRPVPSELGNAFNRFVWQSTKLSRIAKETQCCVLFFPGGIFTGRFRPFVVASQNMLPFETQEFIRYGISPRTARLALLRAAQSFAFRGATGSVFLTRYAERKVRACVPEIKGTAIIPHGIGTKFFSPPRLQLPISAYSEDKPFKIIYISTVQPYKHQWNVVAAIASIRRDFRWPLTLELVGPGHKPSVQRLGRALRRFDPAGAWARYVGEIPYDSLHEKCASADLGIFASSCENLPISLLEVMAAGLPVAVSSRGPMPEIVGTGGLYFDPLRVEEIADAVHTLLSKPLLRRAVSEAGFQIASQFSWEKCADETFAFLSAVARKSAPKRKTN